MVRPLREPDPSAFAARVAVRACRARAVGALQPLRAREVIQEDGGIGFVLRLAENLARPPRPAGLPAVNPFLPYDPELFVCDLSDRHVVLLNKYNLVRHHLLVIPREFEPQESILTPADFDAMGRLLGVCDGLAFYNSGRGAGGSQAHKHLQLVPLPLGPRTSPPVPIEARLRAGAPPLPFVHRFVRFRRPFAADRARAVYLRMLGELALRPPRGSGRPRPLPHNLLFTRRWMLMVPRTAETCDGISVNALGFAGSLFARNDDDLRRIRECGPLEILCRVGIRARPAVDKRNPS